MKFIVNLFFLIVFSQAALAQNTILWKVSSPFHGKVSYILGSFHQFGNSFVDSLPEIEAALLTCDLAVFESIDKVETTRESIAEREHTNEIEKHFSKKELGQLKEITQNWKVDLYKLKPIEVLWKLRQEYYRSVCGTTKPTDTFDEFDGYVMHLAEQHNIPTKGLETNQLEVIQKASGYPDWKKERKNIKIWIKKTLLDDESNDNCLLARRFRNMDIDYNFSQACESNYIILERNNLWMEVIPDLLKKHNTFITVGNAHLRWRCGLLEQLKEQGYIIRPVKLKGIPLHTRK